jgi:predicted  nucleic acid-binding Zn-ribbon protein
MPIVKLNEETGVEETFYTPEEIKERDAEIARLSEENKKKEELLGDKNRNIEGFNKKMEQFDEVQNTVKTLQETIAQKEERERKENIENVFKKIVGNNETLKKELQDSYNVINLPESTPQEIQERAIRAARGS